MEADSHLQGRPASTPGAATERRISALTLIVGFLAALAAEIFRQPMWAAGLLIGAVLAWFNFRWLGQGLDALVSAASAQADAPKPSVPVATYFRALFRYALIALSIYVIFKLLKVPLTSMAVGLCALAVAAVAASVYEVLRPAE